MCLYNHIIRNAIHVALRQPTRLTRHMSQSAILHYTKAHLERDGQWARESCELANPCKISRRRGGARTSEEEDLGKAGKRARLDEGVMTI